MLDARGAAIRHIFKLVSAMQLVCHLKSLTVQFFNQLHRRNWFKNMTNGSTSGIQHQDKKFLGKISKYFDIFFNLPTVF